MTKAVPVIYARVNLPSAFISGYHYNI